MQRVFQDWHAWLKEGILDLAVPMNYAREHDPQTRGWFNGWIAWEKQHSHGRQLAVGVGAYLNTPENTLSQIQRVRAPAGRHRAVGVSFFSFSGIAGPANGTGTATASQSERMSFFTAGVKSEKDARFHEPAFAQPATIPKMDWIEHASRGWLAGTVRDSAGHPVDGARIRLKRAGWFGSTLRTEADGNGWFGFAELKPGRYTLRLDLPGKTTELKVEISSGHVTHSDLVAP
ncbi:MAG: carboxypeptidase regulatory-like domain-containing protein [Acidobacteria bacterium]|nr:carboxypeptidase regulatory-like domain-containing protein [Acidobacteriota bacterium]